jgi:hypothetical protein
MEKSVQRHMTNAGKETLRISNSGNKANAKPRILTEEQKERKRARNRHANMTAEQILKHRLRNRRHPKHHTSAEGRAKTAANILNNIQFPAGDTSVELFDFSTRGFFSFIRNVEEEEEEEDAAEDEEREDLGDHQTTISSRKRKRGRPSVPPKVPFTMESDEVSDARSNAASSSSSSRLLDTSISSVSGPRSGMIYPARSNANNKKSKFIAHLEYTEAYDFNKFVNHMRRRGALHWYCVAHTSAIANADATDDQPPPPPPPPSSSSSSSSSSTPPMHTSFVGRWTNQVDISSSIFWKYEGNSPITIEYLSRPEAVKAFQKYENLGEGLMERSLRAPERPTVLTEEQKQKKRERNRHENMTEDQIQRHRDRNRRKDPVKKVSSSRQLRSPHAGAALFAAIGLSQLATANEG